MSINISDTVNQALRFKGAIDALNDKWMGELGKRLSQDNKYTAAMKKASISLNQSLGQKKEQELRAAMLNKYGANYLANPDAVNDYMTQMEQYRGSLNDMVVAGVAYNNYQNRDLNDPSGFSPEVAAYVKTHPFIMEKGHSGFDISNAALNALGEPKYMMENLREYSQNLGKNPLGGTK